MKNFFVLKDALEYMESHLTEELTPESIGTACGCSVSMLQKLFAYALHVGAMEYVSKRRLTLAARDLLNTDKTVLEIAMTYQYNSHENFTRAFTRLWGVSPSAFRKQWKFTGLFPKIEWNDQEESAMPKRKFDITELFDYLQDRAGTYVLCFDICHMTAINQIDRRAGDQAIVECLRRLDEESSDDMLLFRTGGDEFALVTNLRDRAAAAEVANRVLSLNKRPIQFGDKEIPVSMRVGGMRMPEKRLRYHELFPQLQDVISRTNTEQNTLCWLEE